METTDSALALAQHYLDVERPQDALDALDGVGGDALQDPRYWLVRAHVEFALRQWWKAVTAATNGLALEPDDVALLNILALSWVKMGEPEVAIEKLARALEIAPEDPSLFANLALVYADMQRFPEAREAAAKAVSLAPSSPRELAVRAQVAVLAGDRSAERFIDELLELDPENDVGYAFKGVLAARDRRFGAAARAFDDAARLDPGDADYVASARQTRALMHPVLAPLRPIWRYGWFLSRIVFLFLWAGLLAVGLDWAATAVFLLWLGLIVLSWTGPRYVRGRMERKYRGF